MATARKAPAKRAASRSKHGTRDEDDTRVGTCGGGAVRQ